MAEKGLGRMRAAARVIFRRAFLRLAACAFFAAGGACANIVAVETAPQPAKTHAPAIEKAAPFTLPVFEAPARPNGRSEAHIREGANLNAEPIKVNDKVGNPILIGMVLVWRLKDTYKAMFEIDAQTMASVGGITGGTVATRMLAFEKFVRIQSDAALRQVAGQYAYDNVEDTGKTGNGDGEMTLRDGGEEINDQLEQKLNERLAMAGIEVQEARLNYLTYAPEIAAVMLRRQQANAVIAAREKIVEGAVSMVQMALTELDNKDIVKLDENQKAALVSNLLVVLCADESAQPVVSTGVNE